MEIVIIKAKSKPTEDENIWSYPIEELDYILKTAENGSQYLLWEDRLYEYTERSAYL